MKAVTLLTHLRSSPSRRLVIALFAVPTILLGLLAMHVLANGGMSQASASLTSITQTSDGASAQSPESSMAFSVGSDRPSPADDCGGGCGPSHDMPSHEMLGMICVLALLISVLLLMPPLILSRWDQLQRALLAQITKAAAVAPPTPPSLHVLSISRT